MGGKGFSSAGRGMKFEEEARLKATDRIRDLEAQGKVTVNWHGIYQVTLFHPITTRAVEFFPSRGTIVLNNQRHPKKGLDTALKLIDVA